MTFSAESRHFIWWILTGAQSEDAAEGMLDFGEDGSAFEEIAVMAWVLHQRDFGAMRQAGADLIVLRYEDLLADWRAALTGLFAQLGLPQDGLDKAMLAFDADSDAGTATARDVPVVPLGPEGRGLVWAFLAQGALGLVGKDGLKAGRLV